MQPTTPVEYARAFALNFVFFAVGILIYGIFVPSSGVQVLVLTVLSVLLTAARLRLLQVVERRWYFEDRDLFLLVLDDYLQIKDRWRRVIDEEDYRRYEATLMIGLYRFRAALEVRLDDDLQAATLCGHQRIVRGLVRELDRPHIATMSLVR